MKITAKKNLSVKNHHAAGYFPRFLLNDTTINIDLITYWYYRIFLFFIAMVIKARLKVGSLFAMRTEDDNPSNDAVERIYHREAETYENKHHLTTNFRDTWWRRQSGTDVVSYAQRNGNKKTITLLDVATGIGLSIEEMFKVFHEYDIEVEAHAIDYNQKMLDQAQSVIYPRMKANKLLNVKHSVVFERSDARNLAGEKSRENFITFHHDTFDCVTIMFGIGGIDDPISFFESALRVLKNGGIVSLNDMHRNVYGLDEHWPFFIGKKSAIAFSIMSWELITRPLVLNSLWGWRDTTPLFYILPFVTVYDEIQKTWYGYKTVNFFLDNEAWWYGFPVVPTARIVVEKVTLDEKEALRRQNIIQNAIWN